MGARSVVFGTRAGTGCRLAAAASLPARMGGPGSVSHSHGAYQHPVDDGGADARRTGA